MKKKHLSQIIQGKILMAVAGVFAFLMAITMLFFFFFAKDRTINLIHTGLESCDTNAVCSWDKNRDQAVHAWVEYIGEYLKGEGADAVYSAGFTEYLNTIVSQNKSESELSVIGSDGIIVLLRTRRMRDLTCIQKKDRRGSCKGWKRVMMFIYRIAWKVR